MLIGFTLVSLVASTTLRAGTTGNYDGAQLYLKGFMEAFQGSNYTLPAACMSPAFQSTLDHDFVALAKSFGTADEEKVHERLMAFDADFKVMVQQCDMLSVVNAFNNLLAQKNGDAILFGNIFWNMFDIKNDLIKSFTDLFFKKYLQAGTELGQLAKILVTKPNVQLAMYEAEDYTDFGSGLVAGLGATEGTVCYESYEEIDGAIRTLIEDYQSYEKSGLNPKFLMDLVQFKNSGETFLASCDIEKALTEALSASSSEIAKNYKANSSEVMGLLLNIKDCESDMNKCGYSVGSVVHLLTGAAL